jgi:D-aminopeptidase
MTQLTEWGLLESPILLTSTTSVAAVADGTLRFMRRRHPGMGQDRDIVIPVVAECDDSWLNRVVDGQIRPAHVARAIRNARSGPVAEGNVGAGTGMVTCDFAGGIGTASRKLPASEGGYTVGVLVLSNFGHVEDLRIDGVPVGAGLAAEFASNLKRLQSYGSLIAVVATDAPLLPHQVAQVCKRAALGIGRAGSSSAFESGEIVLGFTTANQVPRVGRARVRSLRALVDRAINPVFQAAIEATEEAIINAVCMGTTVHGRAGHVAPALPLDRVQALLTTHGRI